MHGYLSLEVDITAYGIRRLVRSGLAALTCWVIFGPSET